MIVAMEVNQIEEKDKVEVLMKYLRGLLKESISHDIKVKNIEEAFKILTKAFGNPSGVWEWIQKEFHSKCSNPKGWAAKGSFERRQPTFKTLEFLKRALQYSIKYKDLPNEILSKKTIHAFTESSQKSS